MNQDPAASSVESDADATAELPVIEPLPGSGESFESSQATDVLPALAVPAGTSELAERLREVERTLERKDAQVLELEARLEQAGLREREAVAGLEEARGRQSELEALLAEARTHAQAQSEQIAANRASVARYREQDLTDLRSRVERHLEALSSWQGFRSVSNALLEEAEARNAMLEAQVAALKDSLRTSEGSRAQGQSETLNAEVSSLQAQVAALRAELAVARSSDSGSTSVQNETTTNRRTNPHDRRSPQQDDAPVNATVVMYGDRWEYREEPDESPTSEVEQPKAPAQEAPVRALVRQDGGGDLIYPIGKRTTIGRTPDNDVQIDAPNVSRHHAVVLASAEYCRIEDLDSTNGVVVNGRRVVRQELHDGDTVVIGKTEFRFLQRS